MAPILSANAISKAMAGDTNLKPVVQVVDLRPVGAGDCYRILVSDGPETQQALMATQLTEMVKGGRLKTGSVVQLLEHICSTVQNRRIIVVLNMEVIISESEVIGNLKQLPELQSPSQNPSTVDNTAPSRIASLNGASGSLPTSRFNTSSLTNQGSNPQTFQPTVEPSYMPPPNYRNRGAVMKNEAPPRIIPITALNPYQGRWAIKARVTAIGDLRRCNNARGDGKAFSFDLLDSDASEFRVTCFNAVVDRFYDVVEAGKVYLISKGTLKSAQKSFSHLSHQYEIFLEATSTVELCPDEDSSIPAQQFNFRPISAIENTGNNSILDVIGIASSVNPSTTIVRKNGMETQRRILNLKDVSGKSVELTLWGGFL